MKIFYTVSVVALLSACSNNTLVCDRDAQPYDKFGTVEDVCEPQQNGRKKAPVWQPDGGYGDGAPTAADAPTAAPSPAPSAGFADSNDTGENSVGGYVGDTDGDKGDTDADGDKGDTDQGTDGDKGDTEGDKGDDGCACDTPADTGTSFS